MPAAPARVAACSRLRRIHTNVLATTRTASCGILLALIVCTAQAATVHPPKAIVLMLGDDYGFTNVGFAHGPLQAGNQEMKTPNMNQLVAEGIVLERHYVYKYCSP